MKKSFDLVVPIYNEEPMIPYLIERLDAVFGSHKMDCRVIFVDDGSVDRSFSILCDAAPLNFKVIILRLTRNFGHQIAVTAGLNKAEADFVGIMDADLQDPPECLFPMLELLADGACGVVYGQRLSRSGESWFKRVSAHLFYRFIKWISPVDMPSDVGDFRVFTRRVLVSINGVRERSRFLRGMFAWLGYRALSFKYHRDPRWAGETKYSLAKMIRLSCSAAVAMSDNPMKYVINLGFITLGIVILFSLYMLVTKLFFNAVVPGLTSILLVIGLTASVQIITLGVIGSYVVKTFDEAKARPLYIIDEEVSISN